MESLYAKQYRRLTASQGGWVAEQSRKGFQRRERKYDTTRELHDNDDTRGKCAGHGQRGSVPNGGTLATDL